jgi:hypothetical protein
MSRNDPPSPPISARVLETVNGNAHPQLTHVAGRHPSERAHKAGRRIAGQSVNVGTGISHRTLESPAELRRALRPRDMAPVPGQSGFAVERAGGFAAAYLKKCPLSSQPN